MHRNRDKVTFWSDHKLIIIQSILFHSWNVSALIINFLLLKQTCLLGLFSFFINFRLYLLTIKYLSCYPVEEAFQLNKCFQNLFFDIVIFFVTFQVFNFVFHNWERLLVAKCLRECIYLDHENVHSKEVDFGKKTINTWFSIFHLLPFPSFSLNSFSQFASGIKLFLLSLSFKEYQYFLNPLYLVFIFVWQKVKTKFIDCQRCRILTLGSNSSSSLYIEIHL